MHVLLCPRLWFDLALVSYRLYVERLRADKLGMVLGPSSPAKSTLRTNRLIMEWKCILCTYNNQFLHLACDMCKNPKASQDDEVPDEVPEKMIQSRLELNGLAKFQNEPTDSVSITRQKREKTQEARRVFISAALKTPPSGSGSNYGSGASALHRHYCIFLM